jgi:hypothetical protein
MARGYAEGPAVEEALDAMDRDAKSGPLRTPVRQAVFGSTEADPTSHFLGFVGEVDPDALFDSGEAWGITVFRKTQ